MDSNPVEEAFKPLRQALRPRGTMPVTLLRIRDGSAVNEDVPQKAIDEIIHYHTVAMQLGEPETACMKLAKILLTDSAYMNFSKKKD